MSVKKPTCVKIGQVRMVKENPVTPYLVLDLKLDLVFVLPMGYPEWMRRPQWWEVAHCEGDDVLFNSG